jgi:hypothetical protein
MINHTNDYMVMNTGTHISLHIGLNMVCNISFDRALNIRLHTK